MDRYDNSSEQIERRDDAPMQRVAMDDMLPQVDPRVRYIAAAIAIILAAVSFFAIASWAGSPETYADTIASLDEKRDTVMRLVTGSTGSSAAITLLPGDVGTPIAEKLLDISGDFAIVIGAIYLEKYMLTILGMAAFKVLIPIGCIIFAVAALLNGRTVARQVLFQLSARLTLFGIAIFLVVPASVTVSNLIEATYESTMTDALVAVDQISEEPVAEEPEAGSQEGIDALVGFITNIPENISTAATGVSQEVQNALNRFIETFAVMIVTSCVIPILVLLFFLWLVKTILGINVNVPLQAFTPRTFKGLKH